MDATRPTALCGAGLALMMAMSGPVRAETFSCTAITSVPVTISAQGIYCLTTDLSTAMSSGAAITINANNVVLDLNGHKIGGLAAGPGTNAVGVSASQRQNVTIKNGTIRGFLYAVSLADVSPFTASQGHVIEDIRADQNTSAGIVVQGRANLIRNCQVVATGGSTLSPNADAYGVWTSGPGNRIINNDVATVTKQGSGTAIGILLSSATDALVVDNRLTQADVGIKFDSSDGKYRDNVTSNVSTPYSGGTDAGNNN